MTSKLNVALMCKLRESNLVCLAYSFDMLGLGVCTTRQWQTAGRLGHEFNVCTVQCRYVIPELNDWVARAKYTTARPIATQCIGHECNHMSLTSQLKVALIRKLSVGICTTRHRQTSGRLVQELNVNTVHLLRVFILPHDKKAKFERKYRFCKI